MKTRDLVFYLIFYSVVSKQSISLIKLFSNCHLRNAFNKKKDNFQDRTFKKYKKVINL